MAGLLGLLGGGGLDPASMGFLTANGVNPIQSGFVPAPSPNPGDAARSQLAAQLTEQNATRGALSPSQFNARWQGMPAGAITGNVPLPVPRPANADAAPMSFAPPAPAALPTAAEPTQGQAPQAAVPPTSLLGRLGLGGQSSGPGPFDRITAALANFGAGGRTGGLLGAISGGIQGAATGQRIDPQGIMNQTVQALVNRGVPQDMAMMIATNPQAMQQILPRLMGAKQWQLTTMDNGIAKTPVLVDPITGEARQLDFSQQQQSQAAPQLVRQNGHLYQRQPDGSWRAIQ